jgi:hypothetical protein
MREIEQKGLSRDRLVSSTLTPQMPNYDFEDERRCSRDVASTTYDIGVDRTNPHT